jgi:hypothetical protein
LKWLKRGAGYEEIRTAQSKKAMDGFSHIELLTFVVNTNQMLLLSPLLRTVCMTSVFKTKGLWLTAAQ